MKKLLTPIFLCLFIISAQAQQNKLLDQAFWKTSPDLNAIKAEIDKGASPSQFNANSFDPVVLAINSGAPNAAIEFLLAQPGNDVTKLTHDGRIYLHWAAYRGNAEIVEYLLNKGSKISLEDSHGYTPILFAAGSAQQNTKVYDLFIARGTDLKKELTQEGANALLLAIAGDKDFALTNYFVTKGIDLNSTDAAGNNAFSYAAKAGNIETLKSLVEKGVKPTANAMLMTTQGGGGRRGGPAIGLPVYQYLESLNIKPTVTDKSGKNALHYIVRTSNQGEVIQYFLSKGVDVNQADEDGNNVLMSAAASNRDTAVILTLLPKTKNINQANLKGLTALAMAVRGNSPDVVRLLIAKGADVNALDKAGNNLAYYAVESYRPQTGPGGNGSKPEDFDTKLQILKAKGLDITAAQKNGNTLYHLALAKNDISLLKRIEALGIDVNAKNKEGMTVLHKAALVAKDDAILKYLLSIGAKKDAVTNFKETAFDLATENESLSKNNVSVNFLK
jgi:ankyrin repeat protein